MQDKLLITLIDKFSSSALAELEYDDGTARLVLKKDTGGVAGGVGPSAARHSRQPVPPAEGGSGEAAGFAARGETSPPQGPSALSQHELDAALRGVPARKPAVTETITAPIVATFYAAPRPDAPAFVKKGDVVKKGQTLCVLEAMKMMNSLEAEFAGKIVDIKVKTGDLVEFGQVLFEIEKAGA